MSVVTLFNLSAFMYISLNTLHYSMNRYNLRVKLRKKTHINICNQESVHATYKPADMKLLITKMFIKFC